MFWTKLTPKGNEEEQLKKRIANLEIPDFYIYLSNIIKIFLEDYGFKKSADAGFPLNKDGKAIPLYSYPAIEYLDSLNFKNKKIFEFGSGQSTFYWLEQGAIVTSVENNPKWADKLKDLQNHQLIFAKEKEYIEAIYKFPDQEFDVIIIDGAENRFLCAQNSLKKIKKYGMVILDNSDWYPNSAALIKKELDFIQIDFYGFRPSKPNTSVTSLFLSRQFNFQTKGNRQPNFALGGFHNISNLDGTK